MMKHVQASKALDWLSHLTPLRKGWWVTSHTSLWPSHKLQPSQLHKCHPSQWLAQGPRQTCGSPAGVCSKKLRLVFTRPQIACFFADFYQVCQIALLTKFGWMQTDLPSSTLVPRILSQGHFILQKDAQGVLKPSQAINRGALSRCITTGYRHMMYYFCACHWIPFLKTHFLKHSLVRGVPDATFWRHIVWRHISDCRHICAWRHILTPHFHDFGGATTFVPDATFFERHFHDSEAPPHLCLTPHFDATLFDATFPWFRRRHHICAWRHILTPHCLTPHFHDFGGATTFVSDATFWRHIVWRHIFS